MSETEPKPNRFRLTEPDSVNWKQTKIDCNFENITETENSSWIVSDQRCLDGFNMGQTLNHSLEWKKWIFENKCHNYR